MDCGIESESKEQPDRVRDEKRNKEARQGGNGHWKGWEHKVSQLSQGKRCNKTTKFF